MEVVLMVNSREECNMRCGHCYLPYTGVRNPEDTLDAVTKLQQQGHNIIISGSETLVDLGYLKSYQQAGQKHLLTNGLLLHQDKSLYDPLKAHGIEELRFSLHFGIEDRLNSVPSNIVRGVIKESKKRGFKVHVTTTITSENYQDIDEMCEEAMKYGTDKLHFGKLIPMGNGQNLGGEVLRPEMVSEFFRQISEVRTRFEKDVFEVKARGYFGPRTGSKGEEMAKRNEYCPAGINMVAVDPMNNVYGCPFLSDPKYRIGVFDGEIRIDSELLERKLLHGKRDSCISSLLHCQDKVQIAGV